MGIVLCVSNIYAQTNWELLNPKPTAYTGKDIEFVSTSIGYIINSNELLETTDSGTSWQIKQNITSGNDLSFYNGTGYIVGNTGYVLKSVDNGASWAQLSTGYNHSYNSVNIIDEDNIILSSPNYIVKSMDGGITWESLSIPLENVNKTFFVTSLIGHAACKNGTMLKTIDGGQNWYITQSTNTFPSDFFTIYFVNENIGFSTREHSYMYKTTDGGETWFELTGIGDAIYSFYFLNENIGYATGVYGVIYKTADGGNTWTWVSFQNSRTDINDMYGIYFEDENIGYITGQRGRIIKTIDGGNSWTNHSPTYNSINGIKVFENGTGFVKTGNDFYKTIDNGDNWSFVGEANHYQSGRKFCFVNENVGYSIGDRDVFKTMDGGVTWFKLDIYFNEGLVSIFFLDENVGFISGGYSPGKTMKTIDGGITWTRVLDRVLGQIKFVNEQVGYGVRVGSYYGAIYKTIDGGLTWNISIELEGEGLNAFDFVDENNGYFVGDQGVMYKTNDGGTNWIALEISYECYNIINFYSKNVGYTADDDGRLYRTMNGGENWEHISTYYGTNAIELINNNIFIAGTNGRIYRSNVEFESVVLYVNPAEHISNSDVHLSGNITSNEGEITNIHFEYSTDSSFSNSIPTIPGSIAPNESVNVSIDIISLNQNTTYYYRLKGRFNSTDYTSQVLSFTTLPDYEIITDYGYSTTNTAYLLGYIISNEHDITNIQFEFGTSADALNNSIQGTPVMVNADSSKYITADIVHLQAETQYFFRLKASHQGENIYGNIQSFTTLPEYKINMHNPAISGSDVILAAYVLAYNQVITDIIFEYGTLNYENSMEAIPSQVDAGTSAYVRATLSNLNVDSVYYFRLKATYKGEAIYSEEGVFNISGNIIMVSGTIMESGTNTQELKGIVHGYGAYLFDIHFDYGITEDFGSSVMGIPNFVYSNSSTIIKATLTNLLPNQIYYYRLAATHGRNTIYSQTYQFSTGILGIDGLPFYDQISIYPNPSSGFLNIKLKNREKVNSVELYNILGKLFLPEIQRNYSDVLNIDLSNFGKGIYFLRVRYDNDKTVSKKLILN